MEITNKIVTELSISRSHCEWKQGPQILLKKLKSDGLSNGRPYDSVLLLLYYNPISEIVKLFMKQNTIRK